MEIFGDRNDYHHLNKNIPQECQQLEKRAKQCIEKLYTIDSSIFAHTFDAGKIVPSNPDYWPSDEDNKVKINLRQRW